MKNILFLFLFTISTTAVAKTKSWTCIDANGKEIFTIEAAWVYDFNSGLARVKKYKLENNKWILVYGFINKKGKTVIPFIYADAKDFKTNVTWVKKRGSQHFTLINLSGATIKTKPYKKVGIMVKGYTDRLAVYENGAMGFIDKNGRETVACKYSGSALFYDRLCCVTKYKGDGKYGFIDMNDKVVIPLQYIQGGTSSFHNGLGRVKHQGKSVLINKQNKVVFRTKYKSFQGFKMNRAAVCTQANRKGWGFINWKDKMVIGGDYDYVKPFDKQGYAIVEKNGLKGLVDTNGKQILPMKYSTIYADYSKSGFYCGVYPSAENQSLANSRKDYFLKDFKPFTRNVRYLMSANGSDRILFADTDNKIGFMNREGKIVIPAKYSKANKFQEGLAWIRK